MMEAYFDQTRFQFMLVYVYHVIYGIYVIYTNYHSNIPSVAMATERIVLDDPIISRQAT